MLDELKERDILKLILLVRCAFATFDVEHPISILDTAEKSSKFLFPGAVIGSAEAVQTRQALGDPAYDQLFRGPHDPAPNSLLPNDNAEQRYRTKNHIMDDWISRSH
jgi:hypothetical protein